MQKVLQHLLGNHFVLRAISIVKWSKYSRQAKSIAGPYDIVRFDAVVRKVGWGHMLLGGGVFSIVQVVYLPLIGDFEYVAGQAAQGEG